MEELLKKVEEYKTIQPGSPLWLSVHSGYNKISNLVELDSDIKNALRHLLLETIKECKSNIK